MHPPPCLRARGCRLMSTRPLGLARWPSLNERFRRMEWFVLWLVVKHGLRLWLTAPASPPPAVKDEILPPKREKAGRHGIPAPWNAGLLAFKAFARPRRVTK